MIKEECGLLQRVVFRGGEHLILVYPRSPWRITFTASFHGCFRLLFHILLHREAKFQGMMFFTAKIRWQRLQE